MALHQSLQGFQRNVPSHFHWKSPGSLAKGTGRCWRIPESRPINIPAETLSEDKLACWWTETYVRRCQGSSIIHRSKLYLTLSVFSFLFSYFTRFPLLISSSLLFSSPIPSYQIHLISSHCTSLFPSLLFSSLLFSSPLLSHPIQSHLISSHLIYLISSYQPLISFHGTCLTYFLIIC